MVIISRTIELGEIHVTENNVERDVGTSFQVGKFMEGSCIEDHGVRTVDHKWIPKLECMTMMKYEVQSLTKSRML